MPNGEKATSLPNTRRKCFVCEKEFELTEYFIHIQEESLKTQIKILAVLTEVKDAVELTYSYMQEDDETLGVLAEHEAQNLKEEELATSELLAGTIVVNSKVAVNGMMGQGQSTSPEISKSEQKIDTITPTVMTKKPLLNSEFYDIVRHATNTTTGSV